MCWSCLGKGFALSLVASGLIFGMTQLAHADESLESSASQAQIIQIEKTGSPWQVQATAEEACQNQNGAILSSYEISRLTPATSVWGVECGTVVASEPQMNIIEEGQPMAQSVVMKTATESMDSEKSVQ